MSTLNDARLGSYVYDELPSALANISETSCASATGSGTGNGTERGSGDSSTDGNNNDVSSASERRASLSSRHITDDVPVHSDQTLVSWYFLLEEDE